MPEISDESISDADGIVDRICIAAPCSIGWDNMKGTDEVRLCIGCNKDVYNISAVSKKRAERILSTKDLPCLHIERDSQGKLLTDECPRAFKPLRSFLRRASAIAMAWLAVFSVPLAVRADETTKNSSKAIQNIPDDVRHPLTIQITDGVPIDPRASLTTQQREEFQVTTTKKFLKEAAWNYVKSARDEYSRAVLSLNGGDASTCGIACSEAIRKYDLALKEIEKSKHDLAFPKFVQSERLKAKGLMKFIENNGYMPTPAARNSQ